MIRYRLRFERWEVRAELARRDEAVGKSEKLHTYVATLVQHNSHDLDFSFGAIQYLRLGEQVFEGAPSKAQIEKWVKKELNRKIRAMKVLVQYVPNGTVKEE